MNHSATVGLVEAIADFCTNLQYLVTGKGASPQAVSEGFALQKLHDQKIDAVVLADVVKGADVGIVQRRDGLRLALEALPGFRVVRKVSWQDFDRYRAVQASIAGAINLSHSASAEGR